MIHNTRGEVSALNQQIIVLVSDTFLSLRCIPPGEIQFIPWPNNRDFIKGGNSLCKVSFRILSIQSKHCPLNGRQPLIEQIIHFECENCIFSGMLCGWTNYCSECVSIFLLFLCVRLLQEISLNWKGIGNTL